MDNARQPDGILDLSQMSTSCFLDCGEMRIEDLYIVIESLMKYIISW